MNKENISLESLEKEHQFLQFTSFSPEQAFQLGLAIKEKAEKQNLIVAIDIALHGHQLFHCALKGTSMDNDRWIKRKNNLVNHFGKSSFYIKHMLLENNQTLEGTYSLDLENYAPFGGAFPIIIKETGPVGTITISGLPDEEDHKLVTSSIKEFIS